MSSIIPTTNTILSANTANQISSSRDHRNMANRITFRSMATTWCSIAFFILILFVVPYSAIGYKKFLKGLIVGAMLMKHNNQDEHHYFYPVYHGHSSYDEYGHY